jgi:hypothetical protein
VQLAEDPVHHEEPPTMAQPAHHAPAEGLTEEYESFSSGAPAGLQDPWDTPHLPESEPEEEDRPLPPALSSPLIGESRGSHGRVAAIAALAGAVGLIVGLIAVNALHSAPSTHTHSAQRSPSGQSSLAQVSSPQASGAHVTSTPRPAPKTRSSQRPKSQPITHHTSEHSLYRPPRHTQRSTPVRAHQNLTGRSESPVSETVQSPPATAVSQTASSYVPPSSSGGMEFGFEH